MRRTKSSRITCWMEINNPNLKPPRLNLFLSSIGPIRTPQTDGIEMPACLTTPEGRKAKGMTYKNQSGVIRSIFLRVLPSGVIESRLVIGNAPAKAKQSSKEYKICPG
mmetsp:Transcript_25226/g.28864  ORF Transcript_25226/g.28864 Transcript_25226/m.28864 type:complete len:108 (-) Transcript_25226:479-802(-)